MGSAALAFAAGVLTLLNPCVLPLLPIVLAGAVAAGRWGPLALAAGFVATFTGVGILVLAFGFAVGIDGELVRRAGAVLLVLAGLPLVLPRLQYALAGAASSLTDRAAGFASGIDGSSPAGQLALGAVLGTVWSPCVGPTLGAAIGAAAQGEGLGRAALVMLAFSAGAALALLGLARGARGLLARRRGAVGALAGRLRPALGAVLLLVGLSIASGLDRALEGWLLDLMPAWLVALGTSL